MINESMQNYDRSAMVTELTLSATIDNAYWAGTDDSLYISMGHQANMQLLGDAPRVGDSITLNIDIRRFFGRPSVHLSELDHVAIFQRPTNHPIASDDWELASLELTANGIYTNSTFHKVHRWLGSPVPHLNQVWAGQIKWSQWTNSDHRPIDLNAQTYPIRWLPYIGDLAAWRTYDPAKIDGVGQLVGMMDGKLVGERLSSRQSDLLSPNSDEDSYTWVYTPGGSIIYRRWKHSYTRDYVRHSQLGSGRPVICAGEFKISKSNNNVSIKDVIALVNDASGHYQPDGGACLKYVAEKFDALGIDTSEIDWRWKSDPI